MNYFKFSPNNHTSSRDFNDFIQTISKWPLVTSDNLQVCIPYTVHQPLHTKHFKSSTTKLN